MIVRLVFAAFLVGHVAIHAGFLARRPAPAPGAPAWPFSVERSWLGRAFGLSTATLRAIAGVLFAVVAAGFLVAALATLGLLAGSTFVPGIVVGSIASLVMLIVFFHSMLAIGVATDLVLLWAVVGNGWLPEGVEP